jgi:hypothetical protein
MARPLAAEPDDDQERRGRRLLLAKEQSWRTAWRTRSLLSRTISSSRESTLLLVGEPVVGASGGAGPPRGGSAMDRTFLDGLVPEGS